MTTRTTTKNRDVAATILPTDQLMELRRSETTVYENDTKERITNSGVIEICSWKDCFFAARYSIRPCHHAFCIAHAFRLTDEMTFGLGIPFNEVI